MHLILSTANLVVKLNKNDALNPHLTFNKPLEWLLYEVAPLTLLVATVANYSLHYFHFQGSSTAGLALKMLHAMLTLISKAPCVNTLPPSKTNQFNKLRFFSRPKNTAFWGRHKESRSDQCAPHLLSILKHTTAKSTQRKCLQLGYILKVLIILHQWCLNNTELHNHLGIVLKMQDPQCYFPKTSFVN